MTGTGFPLLLASVLAITFVFLCESSIIGQEYPLWDTLSEIDGTNAAPLQTTAPLDDIMYESNDFEWGGWFKPANWDGSFEIGLNGAEGNSKTLNLRSGFELSRKTDLMAVGIDLDYAKASTNGIESQNFGRLESDIDRVFKEGSPWSLYSKSSLLYDEFRPFDLRLVSNAGVGYKWIDSDVSLFKTRVGAGISREFGGVNDDVTPEANFGIDYKRQLTKRQKLAATVDYFPAWTDFNDYRLVTDLSWEMLIDEANNLSLKFSLLDTYDSTPDGAVPNDINYGLLLLWKM